MFADRPAQGVGSAFDLHQVDPHGQAHQQLPKAGEVAVRAATPRSPDRDRIANPVCGRGPMTRTARRAGRPGPSGTGPPRGQNGFVHRRGVLDLLVAMAPDLMGGRFPFHGRKLCPMHRPRKAQRRGRRGPPGACCASQIAPPGGLFIATPSDSRRWAPANSAGTAASASLPSDPHRFLSPSFGTGARRTVRN